MKEYLGDNMKFNLHEGDSIKEISRLIEGYKNEYYKSYKVITEKKEKLFKQ